MKKKIMAICLASALFMGTIPASYAAIPADFVAKASSVLSTIEAIKVPTDIKLKKSTDTSYENGPLVIQNKETGTVSFDFRAEIAMKSVKDAMAGYTALAEHGLKALGASDTDIKDAIDSCYVSKGQFSITIEYPTTGIQIPASFYSNTGMVDFSSTGGNHGDVFEETAARVADTGKVTITVDVKGGSTLTLKELDNKLDDLIISCSGVTVSEPGTYKVIGKVSGSTTISSGSDVLGDVTYNFVQGDATVTAIDGVTPMNMEKDTNASGDEISGTIIVRSPTTGGSLGGVVEARRTLTVVYGDGIADQKNTYTKGTKVEVNSISVPSRPDYKFVGFYSEPDFKNKVEDEILMNEDVTIYAKWEEDIVTPPLDSTEHFAYIIGYPSNDGRKLVRPDANITREEVATIFYRLLKDETRKSLFTDENSFSDVAKDRWSNKAVSTMVRGGYIVGYPDGTFKPSDNITRAEFVTIVTRFYNVTSDSVVAPSSLTDVGDHWAKTNIDYAVIKGWINGYTDGKFEPDRSITRAEAMKIINSILGRKVTEEGLVEDAERWDDNDKSAWYYYDVIEATNPHTYERAENETAEKWTAITTNKVWEEKPIYEDASK